MKRLILVVLVAVSVLSVGGWSSAQALAAKDSKGLPAPTAVGASAYPTTDVAAGRQVGITRVAIVVSGGPVAYTDQFRQDPPAIVIEFRSRNVIAALEPAVVVNSGIIKEIQSDYYPKDRRALKRLTLTLAQPTAYTIAQQTNRIVVDIETPLSVLPGTMSVGQGVTVLGIEARDTLIQRLKVMEGALQQAGPPTIPVASTPKPVVVTKPVDIPQPVVQPASAPIPASRKGRGGFGYGLLLGIGGTLMAVTGWRRRKKGVVVAVEPSVGLAPIPPIAQGTVVLEQLILKAMQRQGAPSSQSVRGVNYSTSPLLASKTPPWRSRFLVMLVGLGFLVSGERVRAIELRLEVELNRLMHQIFKPGGTSPYWAKVLSRAF
ncbi:MAG: AMIN domain-containing protein, partial [Candidatus Omnitrophica bacterium]|nr:AMIN domain-containing protein [Candidatus Omnitrophota bacterium]